MVFVILVVLNLMLCVANASIRYDWQKNIDVVIPSSLGSAPSDRIERSRIDDHSLYWALVSFSKNAPWVRTIFVLVDGNVELPYTVPDNINVKMVNRCDYMEHCPTQNSHAVYTMIHKIPDLSEHFISTQDDIILGRPMTWKDLFTANGLPFAWRKEPTWGELRGAHHRVYMNPEVFSGKTPTSAAPSPHFMYPMLKSFSSQIANTYADWYAFVQSHKEGRYSSKTNSVNDTLNSQEEEIMGVWESNLIISGRGVYKNINDKLGTLWDEVPISEYGFSSAIEYKSMFMNVNDHFSKDPVEYKKQIKWFWDAMEKLFGVAVKFKPRTGDDCKHNSRRFHDFIEIGTSDFETEIQKSDKRLGLSIEPVRYYIQKLPDKRECCKLNMAVSNFSGSATVYYIPYETLRQYNLPTWLKGCNSINSHHPEASRVISERGLPEDTLKSYTVQCETLLNVFERQKVSGVYYLKVDTEGHDVVILKHFFENIKNRQLLPHVVQFESNLLTDSQLIQDLIMLMKSKGYELMSKGNDTIMRLNLKKMRNKSVGLTEQIPNYFIEEYPPGYDPDNMPHANTFRDAITYSFKHNCTGVTYNRYPGRYEVRNGRKITYHESGDGVPVFTSWIFT